MQQMILFVSLFFLVSCQAQKESSLTSSSELQDYMDTIEAGVNGVSGAADDATHASVVAESQHRFWSSLFISEAIAACDRSLVHHGGGSCSRNVNCDYGSYLWSGTVELNFANQTACGLNGAGDSFTRAVNFARTGPRGTLQTTSQLRTTWDGMDIGGGISVTQIDGNGNLEVEIFGQHKILTRTGGETIFDITLSSSTPLSMNKLSRNGRHISSGVIEIRHNRAQFTVEHSLQGLTYNSSCCYPTGGSIISHFTGARSGIGTVTFSGCGSVTATINGQSKNFSLAHCE
jgi:hypothetical protein